MSSFMWLALIGGAVMVLPLAAEMDRLDNENQQLKVKVAACYTATWMVQP
jgi:hypothetical protein